MMQRLLTLLLVIFVTPALAEAPMHANPAPQTVFDFSFTSLDEKPMPLDQYRGKVLLVVNVASKCGFTKQYTDLQTVWAKYQNQGLIVLGVPSNDFGQQEPGDRTAIKRTCDLFEANFPMTSKVEVSGDNAHPLYKWAGEKVGFVGRPKWNFHKYLFGRDGRLIDFFGSMTSPTDDAVTKAIEAALAENAMPSPAAAQPLQQ